MIVWSTIEVSCPMCAQRLPLRCVGGGVAKGQDSDLFVRMSGEHVIQAEIHCCPKCHFAGLVRDFLDRQISEPMVERFFHEYAERLRLKVEAGRSLVSVPLKIARERRSRPTWASSSAIRSALMAPRIPAPPASVTAASNTRPRWSRSRRAMPVWASCGSLLRCSRCRGLRSRSRWSCPS